MQNVSFAWTDNEAVSCPLVIIYVLAHVVENSLWTVRMLVQYVEGE
jgi:hypothetical protein